MFNCIKCYYMNFLLEYLIFTLLFAEELCNSTNNFRVYQNYIRLAIVMLTIRAACDTLASTVYPSMHQILAVDFCFK